MLNKIFRFAIASLGLLSTCNIATYAAPKKAESRPQWTISSRCKDTPEFVCAIGTSSNMQTIEDARSAAWSAALTRLAKQQLPFLQSVKESSQESLKENTWTRSVTLNATQIDWSGVEEDSENSSPYIYSDETGKWHAHVLLKWPRKILASERKRLKEALANDRTFRVITTLPIGDTSAGVGQITIESDPVGASVIIAGYAAGMTNAVMNGVGVGEHKVLVKLPGYESIEDTVSIVANQKVHRSYQLQKLSKQIVLKSEPTDATVFINNRVSDIRAGHLIRLDYGAMLIRVEKAGYFPETKVINVDERLSEVTLTMSPMPGYISVLSDVQGASVEIDGKLVGTTDALNMRVPGGAHTIRVFKHGYSEHSEYVYINGIKGKSVTAKLAFLENARKNLITSTPEKRKILLLSSGILAAAAYLTFQAKKHHADRGACDQFSSTTKKEQCLGNADSLDKRADKTNADNQMRGMLLSAASLISFGFAFSF